MTDFLRKESRHYPAFENWPTLTTVRWDVADERPSTPSRSLQVRIWIPIAGQFESELYVSEPV